MRPFVIVKPDEALDRPGTMREGPLTLQGQALVIDRAEEVPVGLRPSRAQQMMGNAQMATRLFKSRLTVAVPGLLHSERQGVIRQHGFDTVGQPVDDLLEERRGSGAGLLRRYRHDGLPAEIVHGRKFVVIPGVSEGRQEFDIEVQQLAGPALLVAFRRTPAGPRQVGLPVPGQDAMHALRADTDQHRDARRPEPTRAQAQNPTHRPWRDGPRAVGAPRVGYQRVQATRLHALPPSRQHLTRNTEFSTQVTQRLALHMQTNQKRTNFRAVDHASWHEPPPGGSSYG